MVIIIIENYRHRTDAIAYQKLSGVLGYDIQQLFERRQELSFQPDNVVNFHERLKKAKVLHTSLRSFRSSGAFGTYYGTFKAVNVWRVPCRASFFESFELAV